MPLTGAAALITFRRWAPAVHPTYLALWDGRPTGYVVRYTEERGWQWLDILYGTQGRPAVCGVARFNNPRAAKADCAAWIGQALDALTWSACELPRSGESDR